MTYHVFIQHKGDIEQIDKTFVELSEAQSYVICDCITRTVVDNSYDINKYLRSIFQDDQTHTINELKLYLSMFLINQFKECNDLLAFGDNAYLIYQEKSLV
jgi:hypothetical protein